MGRHSDARKSARRPGKRERARVKNSPTHGRRCSCWRTVPGASPVHVKASRKKMREWNRWVDTLWDRSRVKLISGEPDKPATLPE